MKGSEAEALLEAAWADRDRDPVEAVRLLKRVRSDGPGERLIEAKAKVVTAFLLFRESDVADALTEALAAEEALDPTLVGAWQPRLDNLLGGIYGTVGLFERACEHLEQAVKRADELDDQEMVFACYHDLALLLERAGDHSGADEFFAHAKQHVGDDPENRAFLLFNQAECLGDRDQMAEGLALLEELDLDEGIYGQTASLHVRATRAMLAARLGQPDEAAADLAAAEALAVELGRDYGVIHLTRSRLLLLEGRHDDALEALDRASAMMAASEQRPPVECARLRIEIAVDRGDYRSAYEEAERLRLDEAAFRRENRHALDQLRVIRHSAELRRHAVELERANRELAESMSELRMLHEQVLELNAIDPLTGVFNRRQLSVEASLMMSLARRHGRPFSIAMVDIDHFKAVNDAYLHATGDDVLREVATLLTDMVRESDIVGRYGGDEFVILLPEVNIDGAQVLCERIRLAVEHHEWQTIAGELAVTVTIGVAEVQPAETAEALLNRADQRLYSAKREGRNRVAS